MDVDDDEAARRLEVLALMAADDDDTAENQTNTAALWTPADDENRNFRNAMKKWSGFFEYLTDNDLLDTMPGPPDSEDFYFKYICASSTGHLDDVPTLKAVEVVWRTFRTVYFKKRGEKLPRAATAGLEAHLKELVESGLASEATYERVLTTSAGLIAIAESAWSAGWMTSLPMHRLQFTLWQALALQGSFRNTACLGLTSEAHLTLGHFCLVLTRVQEEGSEPRVVLAGAMLPRNEKTTAPEGTRHALLRTAHLYRDPVFLILARAAQCEALPPDLDLDDLGGSLGADTDTKEFFFSKPDEIVFTTTTTGTPSGNTTPMHASRINSILKKLCDLAGMDRAVTTHSYRYLGIHYMNAAGLTFEKIQYKVGHRFSGNATDIYLRPLPPLDVAAAVFGGPSRQDEALELHPWVTHPTVPPKVMDNAANPLDAPEPASMAEYLTAMEDLLFSSTEISMRSVQFAARAAPRFLRSHCPPGAEPNGDICPGCEGAIPMPPISDPGLATSIINGAFVSHTVRCYGYRIVEENIETLLARYQPYPPMPNPYPMGAALKKEHRIRIDGVDCVNLEKLRKTTKQLKGTCCGLAFSETAAMRSHLLHAHGFWVEPNLLRAKLHVKNGDLRDAAECLPPAEYSWSAQKWIWDPIEKESQAEQDYYARFGPRPVEEEYGLRDDLVLDQPSDIALGHPSNAPDDKYLGDSLMYHIPNEPMVCILCVHSPDLPFRNRMFQDRRGVCVHRRSHLRSALTRAYHAISSNDDDGSNGSRTSPLVADGLFVCPDAVCAAHDVQFSTPLELVWHLSAVHYFDLGAGKTLTECTFSTSDELAYFLSFTNDLTAVSTIKNKFAEVRSHLVVPSNDIVLDIEHIEDVPMPLAAESEVYVYDDDVFVGPDEFYACAK